jgi:hypothetical protein
VVALKCPIGSERCGNKCCLPGLQCCVIEGGVECRPNCVR